MKVTSMTKQMLEECVDLFIDVFSKEPWNDTYESRDPVKQLFENHMNNNYFLGYVAIQDHRIVALSLGMIKPWIEGLEYYIDQFCVSYQTQRTGIGSEFIRQIEKDIKSKNLNGIILLTDRGYHSHLFYEKNSFKTINETIVMAKEI